ncbi:hypothetical protein PAMA_020454 [Pampus argenteus]
MMIFLQIPKMNMSNKTSILIFLIISINYVSGLDIPKPLNMMVKVLDGEVIVLWDRPTDAPSNTKYNVEMAKNSDKDWGAVASCTTVTKTFCNLSSYITDYGNMYKVRVQLVDGRNTSAWIIKRFLPNESELQPPSFTLWATSRTLTVYVHKKPILKKLFPYGLIYTIYLEEQGLVTKNTTAYMKDDVEDDPKTKTFSSVHWGKEYCVSIKVEGNGALSTSSVSPKQCLLLPEQEWFTIAVSSLSIMGVLGVIAIMVTILLCYLRRPVKTPASLKSPVSGWLPLTVGEGTMEVVTDKGWFLSSYKTEAKKCTAKDVVAHHVTITEDNGQEDRRTSMDSGVHDSMESNSATNNEGCPPMRQEDSGCGSMGGSESSTSSQTDYPLQDVRTDTDTVTKREDSGVGLGCQLSSLSMNLNALDSEPMKGFVAGGNYHSQSHTAVQICVCDNEESLKQTIPDAVVFTGYRAGPQSCICSGAGQCTWCHKQGFNETEKIKQYRALCIENGLLSGKSNTDSYKEELTFSSYPRKTQMDMMSDFETTFLHLGDTFPLLTALSPLTLQEGGQDFNMNNVSLSLCDVQLTND